MVYYVGRRPNGVECADNHALDRSNASGVYKWKPQGRCSVNATVMLLRRMVALERFDNRSPMERSLFLLCCDSFADIAPSLGTLPEGNFVTLIIADFDRTSLDALTELSKTMIDAGSRYFCAWGNNCATAHLAFDLACCEFDADSESVIVTTDHGDESIGDAIWYTLNCAYPVDPYDRDCLLYTSPSPRDLSTSRMPSSA